MDPGLTYDPAIVAKCLEPRNLRDGQEIMGSVPGIRKQCLRHTRPAWSLLQTRPGFPETY